MGKWQRVKKIIKTNEPKNKILYEVHNRLAKDLTIKSISKETQIPIKRLEDILLGLEPTISEMVLIANAVGLKLEPIPA